VCGCVDVWVGGLKPRRQLILQLQHAATRCNTLQHTANKVQHTATLTGRPTSKALRQCVAVCCSVLQCDAVCRDVWQCVAVCLQAYYAGTRTLYR